MLGGTPDRSSQLMSGDSVVITTPGAGGFGDPKERQEKLIKHDLEEGNISLKTAKEIYGINID